MATAQLLLSPLAVRQLAQAGSLEPVVREMLADPDANARAAFLERLLARPPAVDELVNQGQFAPIFKAAEAEADAERRRRILGNMLQAPWAVRALAAEGRLDAVFDFLVESPGPEDLRSLLSSLVYNDEKMQAFAAAGLGERLLDLIRREPEANMRAALLGAFAAHPATLRQMAAAGQIDKLMKVVDEEASPEPRRRLLQRLLYEPAVTRVVGEAKLGDELVAWLKAEPDPQNRLSYVRNALQNSRLWQAILAGGQAEVLGELAALEPDETLRQAGLQRMAYSPSGLVAFHVQRGEHDRVLPLLEQHAENDLGRLRLATYLLVTGQIEPRLAEVRQRLEQTPLAADARLLVYLARASGDLSTARRAAEQAGDAGLLKAVLVEQGAWAEVAAKQAAEPCPLPIPVVEQPPQNAAWQRVEQLSLLAGYQRLAGAQQDFDKSIAELNQLAAANPNDIDVRWMCVEGLFLNDRCDQGLKLLANVFPERAFDLLCYR
ncbi:MAG TPA: hypothetical protein VES39_04350, partial [Rhodospirillales bacterium]|nr:hypothetical protein [Rhodospirillales bacterium]